MEPPVYAAEDLCRVQVLVKSIGPLSTPFFKHFLQRLRRLEAIEVTDDPPRLFFTKFVTQADSAGTKFQELQAHRRLLGLICVAECFPSSPSASSAPATSSLSTKPSSVPNSSSYAAAGGPESSLTGMEVDDEFEGYIACSTSPNGSQQVQNNRTAHNGGGAQQLSRENVKQQYHELRERLSKSGSNGNLLVESRCVLFGYAEEPNLDDGGDGTDRPILMATTGNDEVDNEKEKKGEEMFLSFPHRDEQALVGLEREIRAMLRSIYSQLEQRRVEAASYEKTAADQLPCPQLPDEEKYRVGVEQPKSSRYKKKCVGRLRKQAADYALLTGLPMLALDTYQSAIEALKSAQDFLWLGASYEGLGCCAMLIRYADRLAENLSTEAGLLRRASVFPHHVAHPAANLRRPTIASRAVSGTNVAASNSPHQYHLGVSLAHRQSHHSDEALHAARVSHSPASQSLSRASSSSAASEESDVETHASDGAPPKGRHGSGTNSPKLSPRIESALLTTASRLKKPFLSLLNSSSVASSGGRTLASPSPPPTEVLNPYTRSASAINLKLPPPPLRSPTPSVHGEAMKGLNQSSSAAVVGNGCLAQQPVQLSYQEIADRLRLAIEHYEKYSFAISLEYECAMRLLQLFVLNRAHLVAEHFIRERMGRYLDDSFTAFDNQRKARICLSCAHVYEKISFRRKHAFYLRLSVLFHLDISDPSRPRPESEYRLVYPLLLRSLGGYGIELDGAGEAGQPRPYVGSSQWQQKRHREAAFSVPTRPTRTLRPFKLQVKVINEAFTAACRANYYDIAIRHLCFLLQHYYDTMSWEEVGTKLGELRELVENRPDGPIHSLAHPIQLGDLQGEISLPPVQLTRFPQIRDFKIEALPPHLAPKVIEPLDPNASGGIFIYSPFQSRNELARRNMHGAVWVVGCVCEVSIQVVNLLPCELVVNNFSLLTEGCGFKSIPVRLILAPAGTGSVQIKLLGVPSEPGQLRITGYSYEVLGLKSVCSLHKSSAALAPNCPISPKRQTGASSSGSKGGKLQSGEPGVDQHRDKKYSVVVLQQLPVLQLTTSMKRVASLREGDSHGGESTIAVECTVFAGQSLIHTIRLHNSSGTTGLRSVRVEIKQPDVRGGPELVKMFRVAEASGEEDEENEDDLDKSTRPVPPITGEVDGEMKDKRWTTPPQPPPQAPTEEVAQGSVGSIRPKGEREVGIRIFGIDPSSATTPPSPTGKESGAKPETHRFNQQNKPIAKKSALGEEHKVFLRRETTLSTAVSSPGLEGEPLHHGRPSLPLLTPTSPPKQQPLTRRLHAQRSGLRRSSTEAEDSAESTQLLEGGEEGSGDEKVANFAVDEEAASSGGHDLIPYTGRLLTTSISFTYVADVEGERGETYERTIHLPLAIAIVPAVVVSGWHILPGDSPSTRYVVVEVSNEMAQLDAELTYGCNDESQRRRLWVQPREACRVPLLCPCCTEIQSSAFHVAAQRPSHMMQMREIEALRRRLEKHVARYLEIKWKVPALGVDGCVPMGPLLSSVSFLKQLVIPAISLSVRVNHHTHAREEDVVVGMGELIPIELSLHTSLFSDAPPKGAARNPRPATLSGELSLRCYQDVQNGQALVDRSENMIVCGPARVPFAVTHDWRKRPGSPPHCDTHFTLMFRYEGVQKVKPQVRNLLFRYCDATPTGGVPMAETEPPSSKVPPTEEASLESVPVIHEDDIFTPVISFNVATKM